MRRSLFPALAIIIAGLVITLMAVTNEAIAQQNQNCCTYTIDVAGVPASCFPFNIQTFWGNGFPPPVNIGGNGVTPPQGLPWPCPPSSVFFGASINGLFPIAAFNSPVQYNVNGCCLWVRIGFVGGCTVIHVRPC